MYTAPNKILPINRCCQKTTFIRPKNLELSVTHPAFTTPLKISPIDNAPTRVLSIILQLPILERIKINAPTIMRSFEVSPTDPGINPKN